MDAGHKILRVLNWNKSVYNRYNRFRKQIFLDLAQKEAEYILFLLPWLLSINHPACPGYVQNLKRPFKLFNIDNDKEIRKRESIFKRMFGITRRESLLKTPNNYCLLQGLYTIGSIGSVAQTVGSDCDMWVCYDKREFDETAWFQLNQKINLIKDWFDINIKIPVFFFISDITDILHGRFGSVDEESSGSTQKNVLKEEFYRTCIVICGKIPLWWLCHSADGSINYKDALKAIDKSKWGEYDIVDLGNLEHVDPDEYFGSALWQLHKSLGRPLKSIIKMVLLRIFLDASQDKLICHQLRKSIFESSADELFPDPSAFTMSSIFKYYERDAVTLNYLKEWFYLRCEIKPYDRSNSLKKQLAANLFKKYPIDIKRRIQLSNFSDWDFTAQLDLGAHIFELLFSIYKEIATARACDASENQKQDLTILGRKISACYNEKNNKISVIKKPINTLNLSALTLYLDGNIWGVCSGGDKTKPLVQSKNVIYNIAFMVWNNLFLTGRVNMEPNPSAVTLQEIMNVGNRMRDYIGVYNPSTVEYPNYLQKEYVTKLLVIVSFEKVPWEKDINDFCVLYKNSWGELFVDRFNSPKKLQAFIRNSSKEQRHIDTSYYVQRNSTYYEQIIDRTKKLILPRTNM